MPKLLPEQPETAFRNAKPGATDHRISDGKGLFLLVDSSAKGGRKHWRFQYSTPADKRNTLALGDYPTITTATARTKAAEARRLLSEGIDPAEHRKAIKTKQRGLTGNSFEAIAREWLLKNRAAWSDDYARRVTSQLETWIFPWLGESPIAELSAPALLTALRRVEERGRPETTRRTLADCSRVFRYAIASGRAERDPAAVLRGALAPARREHLAALTEPKDVARLLDAIRGYSGGPVVRAALRLAPWSSSALANCVRHDGRI